MTIGDKLQPMPFRRALLWLITGSALIFLVTPLIIIIVASFGAGSYLTFPPSEFSIRYYQRLLDGPQWLESLWMSVQISSMSTGVTILIAIPTAIALVRGRFAGKTILFAIVLSPLVVPGIVTAVAVFFFFNRLHLLGSIPGMAAGLAATTLPIGLIIIAASLQGLDGRLEQAAISLGAGPLQAFLRVSLPLIAPSVIAAALFSFLVSFDELLIPLFLSAPGMEPLSVHIWDALQVNVDPVVAAVSTPLIVIAALVFLIASVINGRLATPTTLR